MARRKTVGSGRPTKQFGVRPRALVPRRGGLLGTVALLLALAPTTAQAATQTRDDPSDAPAGAFGKADLRTVAWDLGGPSAELTVGVDVSSYGVGEPALIGVHVLLDADGDGIADREVVAARNADGAKVDLSLRNLDGTLSSADCQDLSGKATGAQATVPTTVSNGLETFTFSFDPTLVPGNLTSFRWAAFGQAPPSGAEAGPWDIMPDAANPDPAAANPGDRRCNAANSGLSVRMNEGIAFPDADPTPTLTPTPILTFTPTPDTLDPEVRLSGEKKQKLGRAVYVVVACPNEDCTATASGSLRVPAVATARRFKLRKASLPITKGSKAKLRLQLSKKARGAAKRALQKGKTITAKINVTVRDSASNTITKRRTIRLKL